MGPVNCCTTSLITPEFQFRRLVDKRTCKTLKGQKPGVNGNNTEPTAGSALQKWVTAILKLAGCKRLFVAVEKDLVAWGDNLTSNR
jgi:hypothetical protein